MGIQFEVITGPGSSYVTLFCPLCEKSLDSADAQEHTDVHDLFDFMEDGAS